MREVFGADLFMYPADAIVIPTNGETDQAGRAVMGAGVTKAARSRYPHLSTHLGWWLRQRGNVPGVFVQADRIVLTFPTKHEWRKPADVRLMTESAIVVARIASSLGLKTVAMPRVGCGLGGLRWEAVRDGLGLILDDRFVVVSQQQPHGPSAGIEGESR